MDLSRIKDSKAVPYGFSVVMGIGLGVLLRRYGGASKLTTFGGGAGFAALCALVAHKHYGGTKEFDSLFKEALKEQGVDNLSISFVRCKGSLSEEPFYNLFVSGVLVEHFLEDEEGLRDKMSSAAKIVKKYKNFFLALEKEGISGDLSLEIAQNGKLFVVTKKEKRLFEIELGMGEKVVEQEGVGNFLSEYLGVVRDLDFEGVVGVEDFFSNIEKDVNKVNQKAGKDWGNVPKSYPILWGHEV